MDKPNFEAFGWDKNFSKNFLFLRCDIPLEGKCPKILCLLCTIMVIREINIAPVDIGVMFVKLICKSTLCQYCRTYPIYYLFLHDVKKFEQISL